MSDFQHQQSEIDRIVDEFRQQQRRGDKPSLNQLVAQYPDYADELRRRLLQPHPAPQGDHGEPTAVLALNFAEQQVRRIGDYRIVREVGRGGMGIVYEAEQESLGRHVALKVIPQEMLADAKYRVRFEREAKAAARLHHTNIVPVFGVGENHGQGYYVMQFIEGLSLDAVVKELRAKNFRPGSSGDESTGGELRVTRRTENSSAIAETRVSDDTLAPTVEMQKLPGREAPPATTSPTEFDFKLATARAISDPRNSETFTVSNSSAVESEGTPAPGGKPKRCSYWHNVARIGVQVARALDYAHRQGVLHRDIKPGNLLLDIQGRVWVTDFGLAKLDDDSGLTQTGDVLGTLRYMAPECFQQQADARSEVYNVGLTLYELLVFRPAFNESNRNSLIDRVAKADFEPLGKIDREIPSDLQTIIHKAVDREPEHRYQTAGELADDLQRFLDDEPIRARRVSLAERYFRWARRNPTIAVLGAILTTVLVVATTGALLAAREFRNQATVAQQLSNERETARRKAIDAKEQEEAARRKADQLNENLLATQEKMRQAEYATRANFALSAWEADDVGRMENLLQLMRPAPGSPDPRGWEWRYLWKLGHAERLTLAGNSADALIDVKISPDGKWLASLERMGRIKLWDRATGELRLTTGVTAGGRPANLGKGISVLAFSADGRLLAGPGPDDTLVVYAVDTGLPIVRCEGEAGAVLSLAFSPNGERLVASISAHVMRVWDPRDGKLIHLVFGGHKGPVASLAFSPDGTKIVSGSYDRSVKLWEFQGSGVLHADFVGHTDEVRAVAFSPDGKQVYSAGLDKTIRVWDVAAKSLQRIIWGHTSPVVSLAAAPTGTQIVTGAADDTVRIWDASTGMEEKIFKQHTGEVLSVAMTSDGAEVASASFDAIHLWNVHAPSQPRVLASPSVLTYGGAVECVAFSPDGCLVGSGHDDDALRIWNLATNESPKILRGHKADVKIVVFSPDGKTIASGSNDRTVRLWDVATGELRLTFTGHQEPIRAIVFSADGQTVYSGAYDQKIHVWNPMTGEISHTLQEHTSEVHGLALSPDGKTLASASFDQTCILWDLASHQPRLVLRGHTDLVNVVKFSPDGKTLATGANDSTIRIWDADDGRSLMVLAGHREEVSGLSYNRDGRLASSGTDRTIRIWDPATGQSLLILKGHTARVRDVQFSPDGNTLASCSYDRTLKLWEAAPSAVLSTDSVKANSPEPIEPANQP